MQRKDITVGTAYAGVTYGTPKAHSRYLNQMIVREVTDSGNLVVDLVRTGGALQRATVTPRHLALPWDEYRANLRQADDAKKAAQERVTRAAAEIRSLVADPTVLPYFAKAEVHGDGSQTTGGTISVVDLLAVVRSAYAAGQSSVKEA